MLYRGYLVNSKGDGETYVTTLMADDETEAAASVAAWLGDHKRTEPGQHKVRLYSDESPVFTELTITVR